MSATQLKEEAVWQDVCDAAELLPNLGVRALIAGEQVALFRAAGQLYAISAIDPFTKTAVLSRGIVGDLKGQVVVASPIYKQHFNLQTGVCLEDAEVSVPVYPIKEDSGRIWIMA